MGYNFEIKYKAGLENRVADALSRRFHFSAISVISTAEWGELEDEVVVDVKLNAIMQRLICGEEGAASFSLKNGRLLYKGWLVIARTSKWIPKILEEFHGSKLGGHSGFFRTYKRISAILYWEGMKKAIMDFVQRCEVCQRNKNSTLKPSGLQQPLPIPTNVWSDISMDFIGGLPKVQKLDTIFVVVDRMTKYAHFYALAHPFTAKDVTVLFLKEVVHLHGFPSSIVSDRDKIFMSTFWSKVFKQAGTSLNMSSAYQPQTDGQTEAVNKCLETYLCCLTGTKPKQWPSWLPWAEF